jgi:hypothetical protein
LSTLVAGLTLSSLQPQVGATPTKSVRVTSYPEFAEGQVQGVLIGSRGDLRPGLSGNRMALPSAAEDSVRALAVTPDGGVYLGCGGERPTILVRRPGAGVAKLTTLPAATWVTALVALGDGKLLAATAQDGRLFRVSSDGKVELAAQLEADHIWGLARDAQRGLTYVATAPGRLWAIEDRDLVALPAGDAATVKPFTRARKLFESDARQFLALHRGDDGALYVGTADDAVLYRVDPAGATQAIHDFAGNEVRAIAQHQGVLYVAVNDMQRGDVASRPTPTKIVPPAAGTAPGVKPTPPAGSAPPSIGPTEKKGKGALYRIEASGRIEQLHAIVDGFFNALTVDDRGQVFAAASTPGGRGRLYWVTPERAVFTALEVKEADALTVLPAPSVAGAGRGLLLGTGNAGAFYALRETPPADAHYLSKVFAAAVPSHWGRLRYLAEGRVRIETRSGNLAKPDASWSAWQPLAEIAAQAGTGEQAGRIASPAARYLQVKVSLTEKSVLSDFSFFHQPINQRPRITELTIGEDGSGRVARGVRPSSPQRPRTSVVKIRWKTENPDEDDLNYRVYLRPASALSAASPAPGGASTATESGTSNEGSWLRLGGPEPLVRGDLDWNTEAVPDGLYELKLVVSDERSNPPELALTHEHISPPFAIDNRRPEIRDLSFNPTTLTLSGRAVDATSPLADISLSVDGGELIPVGVRDGVLDDLSEEFSIRPPRLSPGSHTLLLRATDGADNVAVGQIVVQVPASPGGGKAP